MTNTNSSVNSKQRRHMVRIGTFIIQLLFGLLFTVIAIFLINTDKKTWFAYLFLITGVVFFVLAPVSFIKSLKRTREISYLIKNGKKLQSQLSYIKFLGSPRNTAQYEAGVTLTDSSGGHQAFISDIIEVVSGGVTTSLNFSKHPLPVDVYVDPANSKRYYVDLTTIPDLRLEEVKKLAKAGVIVGQPYSRKIPLQN
jgi:hypothetical protein